VAAKQAYRDYLVTLFTTAGKSDPSMRADRIIAMETEVAKAHWPVEETRDLDKTYNKMSRDDLKKLAPDFPWDSYLNALGMKSQKEFIVLSPVPTPP
jgi:predicted metalloendopeptidase